MGSGRVRRALLKAVTPSRELRAGPGHPLLSVCLNQFGGHFHPVSWKHKGKEEERRGKQDYGKKITTKKRRETGEKRKREMGAGSP